MAENVAKVIKTVDVLNAASYLKGQKQGSGAVNNDTIGKILQIFQITNAILSNPVVQKTGASIIGKLLPMAIPQNTNRPVQRDYVSAQSSQPETKFDGLTGEFVFNMINQYMDKITGLAGDMTLKESQAWINNNRETAIGFINEGINDFKNHHSK